nr:MAG TPA: hypothetical protein [Caudoviricetes sp.]
MSDGQGAYLNCVAFVVITMLYILLTAIGYVIVCTVADINPHCYMPTASQQGFIFLPLNCQLFAVFELFDIELYSSK